MTAGPFTVLNGVTLTAAEQVSGYTSRTTDGGPDVQGLLESAKQNLLAAQTLLTAVVAVMPAGANKTAINGQLSLLSATS
jgi:hypothetical protein